MKNGESYATADDTDSSAYKVNTKAQEQLAGTRIRMAYCSSIKCVKDSGKYHRSNIPIRIEKPDTKKDFCPDCGSILEWRWKRYVAAAK